MIDQNSNPVVEYAAGFVEHVLPLGYFFVRMKDNSVSTIETVIASHDIMTSFQPEGPVYILVDAGVGSTSEDDIYEYIATSEFGNRVKAQAVVVHELAARLLGNLFMRYIKNKRHFKIFSKHSDAKKWLIERMENPSENPEKKSRRLIFA